MWDWQCLLQAPEVSPWPSIAGSGHLSSSGSCGVGAGAQPGASPPRRSSMLAIAPARVQAWRQRAAAVFRTHLLGRAPVGLWGCMAEAGAPGHLRPAPCPRCCLQPMRDCIRFPNRFSFSLPAGISCQDHKCPPEVEGACCAFARGEDKPCVPCVPSDPLCSGHVPPRCASASQG